MSESEFESHHGSHTHIPPEKSVEDESTGFLGHSLMRMGEITQHLDHQTNILLGFSSAMFVFSAATLERHGTLSIPLIIIVIAAAVASLLSILTIHPPVYLRKRGQKESILYNKKIAGMSSAKEYEAYVRTILGNPDAVITEYSTEIYNLAKYYYRPKRKLFHASRRALFVGIALSALAFIYELFQHYILGL